MVHCPRILVVMFLLLAFTADERSSAQAVPRSQWVDLTRCMVPGKAPKRPKEAEERYNLQRQLLDLDGDGYCEVMDLWIERLGNSDSPGMRTLAHQFFAFRRGNWQPFWTDLKYFPYALRDQATGRLMFIEAALADDIGDDMAIGGETVHVFDQPKWEQGASGTQ